MTGVGVATHAEIQGGGPNHKLFQEDIAVSNFLDQKFPWKWSGRGGHCNLVTSSSPYRLLIAHSDDTSATLLGCDIAHCSARTSCEDGYTRNLYKYVGWPWVQGTIHVRATHVLNEELSTRKCRWQHDHIHYKITSIPTAFIPESVLIMTELFTRHSAVCFDFPVKTYEGYVTKPSRTVFKFEIVPSVSASNKTFSLLTFCSIYNRVRLPWREIIQFHILCYVTLLGWKPWFNMARREAGKRDCITVTSACSLTSIYFAK